jgi:hypothetical protein
MPLPSSAVAAHCREPGRSDTRDVDDPSKQRIERWRSAMPSLRRGLAAAVVLPVLIRFAGPAAAAPSLDDKSFLNFAAEDNQAEIQLCLLAKEEAKSDAVRAFAI